MNTATATSGNAAAQIVGALLTKLQKQGLLVFKPTDNKAALQHLGAHFDATQSAIAWNRTKDAGGSVPDNWNGVLIVNTRGKKGEAHTPQTRVVAFPDMDEVFSDKTMRGNLYDEYIRMLAKAARDHEAEEAAFSTLNGPWADEGYGAYKFQAEAWVSLICDMAEDSDKMRKNMNMKTLRLALESSEFAKARFPGITTWDRILSMMSDNAARNGYSTAQFDLWKSTRDVVADTSKNVVTFDDNAEAVFAALAAKTAAKQQQAAA